MKIKSSLAGLIMTITIAGLVLPTQAAWACQKHHKHYKHYTHYTHYRNCTGQGWHMVSRSCNIRPAGNWQEYNSGVYTQPVVERTMFMR